MKLSEKSPEGKAFTITDSFLQSPKEIKPEKAKHLQTLLSPRYTSLNLNSIKLNKALLKEFFHVINSDRSKATAESEIDDKHNVIFLDITNFAKEIGAEKLEKDLADLLKFKPYIVKTAEKVLVACPYKMVLPPTKEEKEAMKMGFIAMFGGASAFAPDAAEQAEEVDEVDEVDEEAEAVAGMSHDEAEFLKLLLMHSLAQVEAQPQPHSKKTVAQIQELREALAKLPA